MEKKKQDIKQLAWSAYLKGGGHKGNYEDFLVWYNDNHVKSSRVNQIQKEMLNEALALLTLHGAYETIESARAAVRQKVLYRSKKK